MATRSVNVLIGCNEPSAVQAIKTLLADAYTDGAALNFTESSRCDDFIQQASNGNFDFAVIYPNCFFPVPATHAAWALRSRHQDDQGGPPGASPGANLYGGMDRAVTFGWRGSVLEDPICCRRIPGRCFPLLFDSK